MGASVAEGLWTFSLHSSESLEGSVEYKSVGLTQASCALPVNPARTPPLKGTSPKRGSDRLGF